MKEQSPKTNGLKSTKLRPLTRKQKLFVKHLVDNPKSSATEAVVQAYDVKDRIVCKKTMVQ